MSLMCELHARLLRTELCKHINVLLNLARSLLCSHQQCHAMCKSFWCHVHLLTLPLRASSYTCCHTLPPMKLFTRCLQWSSTFSIQRPLKSMHDLAQRTLQAFKCCTGSRAESSMLSTVPSVNLLDVTCFFWHLLSLTLTLILATYVLTMC